MIAGFFVSAIGPDNTIATGHPERNISKPPCPLWQFVREKNRLTPQKAFLKVSQVLDREKVGRKTSSGDGLLD
jgi:hypothetical protein